VTFAAFLDVVLIAEGCSYATVDSDYGCGIISRHPRLSRLLGSCPDRSLAAGWQKLGLEEKYTFLDAHRSDLLRLTVPDDFSLRLTEQEKRHSKWSIPALKWSWPLDRFRARARRLLQPAH
jgi:hypothetical protein